MAEMLITQLTLNVTNAARGQELLVGLLSYVDDMMGLDYDSVAAQLDYVANYTRMKKYEEMERAGRQPVSPTLSN